MRRITFCLAVIMSIIAMPCCTQQELETAIEESETELIQLTVKAHIGDTDNTKTAVQANGTSIYWSVGDAINLFYGNKSSGQFTSDLSEPSASADFNGTISVATGTTEIGGSAQSFWGVYPYNVANTCDGTGVVMTLPSTQAGVPNTFANNLNPTVAKSSGLDLAFYNVGSWFLFSVTQENVASATLRGNNNEDLAGTIRVSMDANSRPVAEVQEGAKSITITPLEGDSFVVGEIYYMVLLPQTLTNGYTLTLTKTDGSTANCVVGTSAEFVRSSFRRKRNADSGLNYIKNGNISFVDDAVKAICIANWDTNDDGELSYEEAAAVTTIPYSAFANNTTITSFDEFQYFYGVTTLEYDSEYDDGWDYFGSFYHCTSLASITLPPTLTTISYACFRDCSALTSITIPASVTTIQQIAFLGCTNLDVYMESETPCTLQKDNYGTYAEPYAFGFLTSGKVKTIYVPTEESVAVYKAATYWSTYASRIKYAVKPTDAIVFADNAVKDLCVANWDTNGDGELSYEEAAAVTNVGQVFEYNSTITSFNELELFTSLYQIDYDAFNGCSCLASITIPSSVGTIQSRAFKDCTSLSRIIIPEGVSWLKDGVFSGCEIEVILPSTVSTLGNVSIGSPYRTWTGAFYEATITHLTLYASTLARKNDSGHSIVTYCKSSYQYTSSDKTMFRNHTCKGNINGITILRPDGAATYDIPAYAFAPNGKINAFYTMTEVIFDNGLRSIGDYAFRTCGFSSVTLPNTITTIGINPFDGCNDLAAFYGFGASSDNTLLIINGKLCSVALAGISSDLIIPDGTTSIGPDLIPNYQYYSSPITLIDIPDSVDEISYSFYNSVRYASLIVRNPVPPTINTYSFYWNSITSISVPAASLDAYKAASIWSSYESKIQAISE